MNSVAELIPCTFSGGFATQPAAVVYRVIRFIRSFPDVSTRDNCDPFDHQCELKTEPGGDVSRSRFARGKVRATIQLARLIRTGQDQRRIRNTRGAESAVRISAHELQCSTRHGSQLPTEQKPRNYCSTISLYVDTWATFPRLWADRTNSPSRP